MQLYYLRLRRDHPPQGKHNALQKGAYTAIVLLGVVSVLSGFAIYKPVQLAWLTALFGGYELARYWHFWAVWIFVAFTLLHVVLVLLVDPASLRAMITGWYRGRFPSHGYAGGVNRRDFLRLGLAAGPASLIAACGWDGGALLEPRLRMVAGSTTGWASRSSSNRRLAHEYPIGANGGAGVPGLLDHLEPRRLSQSAGGLVARGGRPGPAPERLTLPMLQAMPSVTYTVKHHCVEGWTASPRGPACRCRP